MALRLRCLSCKDELIVSKEHKNNNILESPGIWFFCPSCSGEVHIRFDKKGRPKTVIFHPSGNRPPSEIKYSSLLEA